VVPNGAKWWQPQVAFFREKGNKDALSSTPFPSFIDFKDKYTKYSRFLPVMSAPNNNSTNPNQQFVGAPQYYVQSGPVYNQQPGGVPIYQPQQIPVFYPQVQQQQGQQAYAGSFQTPYQPQQPQQPQVVFIQQGNEQTVPLISNVENPWRETCDLPVKQRLLNVRDGQATVG
jgi:hypothetical protein